jgi:hypothetical protein
MSELTTQEAKVLEAASELLREAHRGVRFLDVIAKALAGFGPGESTRRAWETFEREVNRLGYSQDPECYCGNCAGEGERLDVGGKLDVCMACHGNGFLGYRRDERRALGVATYAFPAHDPAAPELPF